jgi:hypothetical protein
VSQTVRVIHGSSASLANALAALTRDEGVQATPNFSESSAEGAEMQFISVRVEGSNDWDAAAARVESLLPTQTEYILTADD